MRNFRLRVRKLWGALLQPIYRRGIRYGVAATIEHKEALAQLSFDCILDVGANKGQFALFSRCTFGDCRIISFEPLERPAEIFESLFRSDPHVRLVRAAIAARHGTITMHITEEDDSSSPLEVNELQNRIFGSRVIERREVPCGPLKEFLTADDLGARTLLKIDAQGYELEVLRGVESLFDDIEAIYCEVSFMRLYKGQALASDIISYLKEKQFNLCGVYNLFTDKREGPVQADMLFIRADTSQASQGNCWSAAGSVNTRASVIR